MSKTMEKIEQVEQKAVAILDQARALVVTNEAEYVRAGEFIVLIKQGIADVKAFFKPMKDKAFQAHRAICDQETNSLAPFHQAMKTASDAALPYKQEQDRLAREEAELQRQEMIKAREAEKLKEAELLEAFGDTEQAEKVLQQAVIEPRRAKVESTLPKVAGLSSRAAWKGRILRPREVNRAYCTPDQSLINDAVQREFKAMRDPTPDQIKALEADIGGVEIYLDESFAGAGGRK